MADIDKIDGTCEICGGTGIISNENYEDIHFPDVTCECARKEMEG